MEVRDERVKVDLMRLLIDKLEFFVLGKSCIINVKIYTIITIFSMTYFVPFYSIEDYVIEREKFF